MELLRVQPTCQKYSISPHTLYHWKYKNRFPGLFAKLGKIVYVDILKLEEILAESKNERLGGK
jgi:hypothetical protein